MKKIYISSLLICCFLISNNNILAQTLQGACTKADFGLDGYVYANGSEYFGSPTPLNFNNADDWFLDSTIYNGPGRNVISMENSDYFRSLLMADQNVFFATKMSVPPNSIINGRRWQDGTYVRDYFGGSNAIDSSSYVTASKNGEPLEDWDTGIHNVVPKNDLIDCYAHLRRDGTNSDNPLWLFLAFSRISSSGNSYFDAELFANEVVYDPITGFEPVGTDEGHTAWQFDANGNISKIGDMIVTVKMNTSNIPEFELRIWVRRFDFNNASPTTFEFGNNIDGASVHSEYGYADILPPMGNEFGCGVTNQESWVGPPWGTLDNLGNFTNYYTPGQFVEIGLNLYDFGIDPQLVIGLDACDLPFNNVIFKARASDSFTAQLKDFAGPFEFIVLDKLESTAIGDSITCDNPIISLQVEETYPDSYYEWSTIDGNILTDSSSIYDTIIYVDAPGTYILASAYMSDCEFTYDTIVVAAYTDPPPANIGSDPLYDCTDLLFDLYALDDGFSYAWLGPNSTSFSGQQISVSDPGWYYLEVTNLYGCTAMDSIFVLEYACQEFDPPILETTVIFDTLPPFFDPPPNITLECTDDILDLGITGNVTNQQDNCDPDVVDAIFFDEYFTNGFCTGTGQVNRNWSLTDDCGNIYNAIQQIILIDTRAPDFVAPPDATILCDDDPDDLNLTGLTPIATDACDSVTVEVNYTDEFEADFNCNGQIRIQRIWTAIDDCGNVARDTQFIEMLDTLGPEIIGIQSVPFVACDSVPEPPEVLVIDNCDPNPTFTITEDMIATACPNSFVLVRTWTAVDHCGNISTATQELNVQDVANPTVLTFPEDITISCDSMPDPYQPEVADNCDSDIDISYVEDIIGGTCEGSYIIERTWTWTDDCDNDASAIQTITIEDSTSPSFTVPADLTIYCFNEIDSLNITGDVIDESDNCTTILAEATFTDSIEYDCLGTGLVARTWSLVDDCGNITEQLQLIQIVDTIAPVFSTPPSVTLQCDQDITDLNLTGEVTSVSDNCGYTSFNISYSDSITITTACSSEQNILRIWTVSDDCGNIARDTQYLFLTDTVPPVMNIPANITLECDTELDDLDVTGEPSLISDNCDQNIGIPSYTDALDSNGYCEGTGVLERTWILSDECGNSTTAIQYITLIDTITPVFALPDDLSISCDGDPTDLDVTGVPVEITDNCTNQLSEITYSDSIVFNSPCEGSNIIYRTWVLADACGNEAKEVQIISVEDTTPPIVEFPDDVTISCAPELVDTTLTGYPIILGDNCSTTFGEIVFMDSIFAGDPCSYTVQRTWLATDACGNIAADTQLIVVSDLIAPILLSFPNDTTINCNDPNPVIDVVFIDNCDTIPLLEFEESTTMGECSASYLITRTWTSTDNCNNSNSYTQLINVVDTIAPSFIIPDDLTVSCDTNIDDLNNTGIVSGETDNCDSSIGLASYTDSISFSGNCLYNNTVFRIWSLSDECGNSFSAIQTITVQDTLAPTFVLPNDVTIECTDDPTDLNFTGSVSSVSDNCDVSLGEPIYLDSIIYDQPCNGSNIIYRKWELSDLCGNSVSGLQTIIVEDNNEPVIAAPEDITLDCFDALPDSNIVGQVIVIGDECSDNLGLAFYTDNIIQADSCNYIIERVWELSDDCGNVVTEIQTISIQDTIAPIFNELLDTMTLNCDSIPAAQMLTAMDNCDANPSVVFVENIIPGACANNYTLERIWTASDRCGNTSSISQTLEIQDFSTPVIFSFPPDMTVSCDSIPPVESQIILDNCDSDVSIDFVETNTGGTCPINEVLTRTWTWTDNCGNSNSHTQTITVIDETAPSFTAPVDVTIDCTVDVTDLNFTGSVEDASDNCDVVPALITYQDSIFTNSLCDGSGLVRRTWMVSDSCGNTNSGIQLITIIDTIAPTFSIPEDVTLACGEDPDNLNLTGEVSNESDACGTLDGTAVYSDSLVQQTPCDGSSIIFRTWRLSDDCGNEVSALQTIHIVDNQAPVFSNLPIDMTVDCDMVPPLVDPTVVDSCGGNFEIDFEIDTIQINCTNAYTLARIWTATDACGNEETFTQQIIVIDTIAPSVINPPLDTIVQCNELPAIPDLEFTDTCNDSIQVDFEESITDGPCVDIKIVDRIWTATDACGNTTVVTQQIVLNQCSPELSFSLPPDNSICEGEDINFEPVLSDGYIDPAFQWQFTTDTTSLWQNIDSATNFILTINNASVTQTGFYRILIADDENDIFDENCSVISDLLFLEVLPNSPPTIIDSSICEGDTIFFQNQILTLAGTYADTLTALNGCDSIVSLNLLVYPNYIDTTLIQLCVGIPYMGTLFENDTTLVFDYQTVFGCDSILIKEIQVLEEIIDTFDVVLCLGQTYEGVAFTQDTTLLFNGISALGCDSTAYTDITVNLPTDTLIQAEICEGDSLIVANDSYNQSGTYTVTTIASNGCDSIINIELIVWDHFQSTTESYICVGDSINGIPYFSSQTLIDSFNTIHGCDSILIHDIIVQEPYVQNFSFQICEGEDFNGTIFQNDTLLVDSLQSSIGCDSIILYDIQVILAKTDTIQQTLCYGENWNNTNYYNDTLFVQTYNSNNNCDSIVTYMVWVLPLSQDTQYLEICQGESIVLDGQEISETGSYQNTYINTNGCDSFMTTLLTVHPFSETPFLINLCEGETYFAGGEIQSETGVYIDTLQNVSGCDSLLITNLVFESSYSVEVNYSICENDSIFLGGDYQNTAGTFVDSFTTVNGCDSIVQSILSVLPEQVHFFYEEVICEGDSIFIANAWQTSSGTFTEYFNPQAGCDSIVHIELIVQETNFLLSENEIICFGEEVQLYLEGAENLENIEWFPDFSLSCNDCLDPIAFPDVTTTYTVTYPSGCDNEILESEVAVFVYEPLEVDLLETEITIIEGDTAILMIVDADTTLNYTWLDGQGNIICDTCIMIEVLPFASTTYSVLVDDPNYACTGQTDIVVFVERATCENGTLQVSNVIFPQSGGYGDHLEIKHEYVGLKVLRIYNRWGQLVFETNDFSVKWDGTFRGQLLNPGVYVYYILGYCEDEDEEESQAEFIRTGNITLIH